MEKIPVMFCFDNNYVIPAAACFNSILQNSNKDNKYEFYILHSNISEKNISSLTNEVNKFDNCSIKFIYMDNKYDDIFEKIPNKSHFSKELIYKLICTSLFPKLEKIIISDVDVIFLDDIAKIYDELDDCKDYYIAGIPPIPKKTVNIYREKSYTKFSEDEIKKLENGVGAGFLLLNLQKMRDMNMENEMLTYLNDNLNRLIQIEQDVINIVCYGHIKRLSYNYMVCSYEYDDFKNGDDFTLLLNKNDMKNVKFALENPIQLHYATTIKPWKYVDCTKSSIWFKYFFQTDFCQQYLNELPHRLKSVDGFFPKLMKTRIYKYLLWCYHFMKKILGIFHVNK